MTPSMNFGLLKRHLRLKKIVCDREILNKQLNLCPCWPHVASTVWPLVEFNTTLFDWVIFFLMIRRIKRIIGLKIPFNLL
mmetsp:Transcript_42881/g.43449  ORF Transcript_42881/g.43449 Transcript_42881/m.43449 type:complete len:80 (+) Transcript_42881:452-691(+)